MSGAILVAIAVSACAPGEKAAPSPSGPSPAKSSITTDETIARSYTDYWPASVQAAKRTREEGRVLLAPFATKEHLAEVLDGAADWRRKKFEPWGHVTVHVTKVDVNGQVAHVTDCQDASTAGIANARNHQLIHGTAGGHRVHIRAEMRRGGDGRWRLRQKELLETPCTP